MSEFTRQTAPDRARKLVEDLAAVGVAIPDEITAALAHLQAVDDLRPPFVDLVGVTDAYLSADRKRIAAALDEHVKSTAAGNAWREARIKAAQTALAAITSNGDTITRALAELAAPLIRTVTDTAQIDTHDTGALIRAGRTDEAHAAARYDIDAGELSALYALRGKVTRGAEYGRDGVVCATWRDPRPVDEANRGKVPPKTPAETFRRGVLAGGVLWFPTPGEAEDAAAAIAAKVRAETEREAAEHWRKATGAKLRTA